jgi:hypothetical protein
MDLVTACNSKEFFGNATALIASFRKIYPESKVFLCVFGELANTAEQNHGGVETVMIPNDCEHAWNPRFYLFKNHAYKIGIERCTDSFIWLDSRNRVMSRMVEIEDALEKDTRFFDQYPHQEFYKIKNYSTALCVKKLGLNQEEIADWYGYQSLIQAYKKTPANERFINAMLYHMHDPEIAGPSNYTEKPDGPDSCVRHHRNDLSVLSLLIPRFGFDQPYNIERSRRYGDRPTYERFGGCEGYAWEQRILTRQG